jgi:hypothetical protein
VSLKDICLAVLAFIVFVDKLSEILVGLLFYVS